MLKKLFKRKKKENETSAFTGFVLLDSEKWNKEKLIEDVKSDWGIDIFDDDAEAQDEKYKDVIIKDLECGRVIVSFMNMPVPNGEAEFYAQGNYMWKNAVDTVKTHKAQLLVSVTGDKQFVIENSILYTQIVSSCLKQDNTLAVYSDGAVYEKQFYQEVAALINEEEIPILDLVWIGIYQSDNKIGVYTYGMKKFYKDEMEVYEDKDKADLNALRNFLVGIIAYVICSDVILKHGETIGFTEEQKLAITKSKGIALDGDTLKIEYGE